MNILISSAAYVFSDHLSGGENRVVAGIVRELDRRGHSLYVIAPRHDYAGKLEHTRLITAGGYRFDADGDYFRYRLNWWLFNLRALWIGRRLRREVSLDVIHHVRPAYLGRFSLAWLIGAPFIYGPVTPVWENVTDEDRDTDPAPTRRRPTFRGFLTRLLNVLEEPLAPACWRRTMARSARVLVQIPLATKGLPEGTLARCEVVGLATDIDAFAPGDARFERPTVLYVGKLFRRKGLADLIRAMVDVADRVPAVHLHLVGEGPSRAFFESLVDELGLGDTVSFEGAVPHAETVRFYQRAHVFCLPSVGEPAGNVLLEAMASGLPIVSTNTGGTPEFVPNGEAGRLVPPRDPDALAAALVELLTDREGAERIGASNRRRAEEHHDIRGLVDRIEAVYRDVAPRRDATCASA